MQRKSQLIQPRIVVRLLTALCTKDPRLLDLDFPEEGLMLSAERAQDLNSIGSPGQNVGDIKVAIQARHGDHFKCREPAEGCGEWKTG